MMPKQVQQNRLKEKLAATFQKLVDKNKITSEQAAAANNHLIIAHQIEDLKNCDLIVEAIVERLDIKQSDAAA